MVTRQTSQTDQHPHPFPTSPLYISSTDAIKPLTHLPSYLSAKIDHGTYFSKYKQKNLLPPQNIKVTCPSESCFCPSPFLLACNADVMPQAEAAVLFQEKKTKNQRSSLNITPKPAAVSRFLFT